MTNFDRIDRKYSPMCVFPEPKRFGKFLFHNRKMCSVDVKNDAGSSKLRWIYKTDELTYFNRKHRCINLIWCPCCLGRTVFENDL